MSICAGWHILFDDFTKNAVVLLYCAIISVSAAFLNAIVSLSTAFIAIGMSIVIGMIAGAIPAYQGSKLKPVDALRYE